MAQDTTLKIPLIMGLTIDEVLEEIGSMGRYQIRLVFIFCYFGFFVVGFQTMLMTFITGEPGWQCVENSTVCNVTGVHRPGGDHYKLRCDLPRSDWEFAKEFTSTVTQWDLVCEDSIFQGVSSSVIFAGWLLGAIFIGWLSDRTGRRYVVYFGSLGLLAAAVVSALSPFFWLFVLSRAIVGVMIGGSSLCQFILMTEFVGVRHRNVAATLVWFAWTCAFMATPLFAYFIRDWRILTIAVTVTGVPFSFFWWFIPESMRWLLVKGRVTEAEAILRDVAAFNRKKMPDEGLLEPLNKGKVADFRDLFRNRKMVQRTLILWFAWLVNAMVYYGVSLSSPSLGGSMYLNFFLTSIVEIPANFAAIYSMKRFGRKKSVVIPMILASLAAMGAVLLVTDDGNTGYLAGRITMAMLAKFFIMISFDGVYVYAAELFPTVIRNIGMGTSSAAGRIGSFSSAYVAWLTRVHPLLPYGVMGIGALLSGLLCLLLPETKDKPTSEVCESESQEDKTSHDDNHHDYNGETTIL
ncbi:organic cation transporter protein isoform X1 [Nematostella vectensis]|uniref:organic cation transporter protein isoform X1 n=2 Tax=Nematostella vectensis TaxID=45351 RepID=UPI0020776976|nr:organic cation transporter protein isoform X1 [Nematostella vectensis]